MHIRHALLAVLALLPVGPAIAQESIPLTEGLAIERLGSSGRRPFFTDAVTDAITRGTWAWPSEGDTLSLPGGPEGTWKRVQANENGGFRSGEMRGGYVAFSVEIKTSRAMILEARGHSLAYVNGAPRGGDPYSNGLIRVPVMLHEGTNELLFRGARGQLRATLVEPAAPIAFDTTDYTMPDLIEGETGELWAGIPLLNATQTASRVAIRATAAVAEGAAVVERSYVPMVAPMSVYKAAVRLPRGAVNDEGQCTVLLEIVSDGEVLHSRDINIRSRTSDQKHVRTFVSAIDGSVQYYGVTPMRADESASSDQKPAMFLTLHGAGVEGRGQANAYGHKDWGYVVAPTNRRAFGFDWEDWGRLDAMEVLEEASGVFGTDPMRTYLTGHSMGGHGTWQVGVHFPDRFAAIAPSAGWVSFWSYGGLIDYGTDTPVREAFTRAASPSDTMALSDNYAGLGVYILHGDADNNVPVSQARTMRSRLAEFHRNFAYYEQPGAGHWWGNRCVDWPPMFDFFKANSRAARLDRVQFVTAEPGVSSAFRWAEVLEQSEPLAPSSIDLRIDAAGNALEGTTANVMRMAIDVAETRRTITRKNEADEDVEVVVPESSEPLRIVLDGEELSVVWDETASVILSRESGSWAVADGDDRSRKGPHRSSLFKSAFNHDAILIYGSSGTDEERAWAFNKARYDAETFKYRGNGSFDLMSDLQFILWSSGGREPAHGRNVVLYGNAATNLAWDGLVDDVAFDVAPAGVRVGQQAHDGDIGVLAIRPMVGSDDRLVGIVGGTTLAGCRATDRMPYFVSGVSFPDYTLLSPEIYSRDIDGVIAAGYFQGDWSHD